MKKIAVFILLLHLLCGNIFSQTIKGDTLGTGAPFKLTSRSLVAPAVFLGLGVIGSQIDAVKELDFGLREGGHFHSHTGFVLEDAVQYAPVGAMYALKLSGVKSSHSYLDMTVLTAASYCITAATTWVLKQTVDELRPNGKDHDAFPSGHAAISFMGAELLRLEYRDVSPWIGYAGYAVATFASMSRIRHAEHWFPDLLAGAGVGILGTRVAYWITPRIQSKLFPGLVAMPYCGAKVKGISLAMVF